MVFILMCKYEDIWMTRADSMVLVLGGLASLVAEKERYCPKIIRSR